MENGSHDIPHHRAARRLKETSGFDITQMIKYAFSRISKRTVALFMMMIQWDNDMSVGIGEFSAHHKRIIDPINRLDASLKTGDARKVSREALAELSNYSFYHCLSEEEAVEKCHYYAIQSEQGRASDIHRQDFSSRRKSTV